MQWSGKAIVLSARRFGEHGAIVKLFSADNGLYAGVARHAFTRRQRGIFEPGNILETHWAARLAEQLGSLRGEVVTPVAAIAMQDMRSLAMLRSAVTILEQALPEREPAPLLYARLEDLCLRLMACHGREAAYVRLEHDLLAHLGYGLDLSTCAATGQAHDLAYVSPRSGRAVSSEAAQPYRDRMLPLPRFLKESSAPEEVEDHHILDGLRLTGYFLGFRAFAAHHAPLPASRSQLIELLETPLAASA